jgi:glycosyltransferase involved in cell wall biosynthesis
MYYKFPAAREKNRDRRITASMEETGARWICCQLGAREHYAVARALHRLRVLRLLLTDTWVRPSDPLGVLKPSLRTRFHADLATANICAPNLSSLAFELRAKLAGLDSWRKVVARNQWFQKVAVTRLSRIRPADGSLTVMAYSYAALEIFKLARARGWRTVLGQIDPGLFEERIVARLYEENSVYRREFERPPSRYWVRWREECALADRIVVNSLWSREALVTEGLPAAKIRVVPLAYEEPKDTAASRRQYPTAFSSLRPLRVLFLGQINLRKGIGPLFDAIRLLRGEPIEFTFVGPMQISVPPDLREDPRVRWVGWAPREDTSHYYREADVFLFPTFSDGFGLTQLEAQAWNLPIIATRFCGNVVKDDSNGWLLSEITAREIDATLRRCLAHPSILQEFSANSVRTERFGLAHVGKQWLNVFE